jgi:predicted nucleic acid-binding protein
VLVSGDKHLLDLKGSIPVFSPAEFISRIQLPPRLA